MKNTSKNRERVKLLLAELKAELELLESEELNSCKAGYGGFGGYNEYGNLSGFVIRGGTGGFLSPSDNPIYPSDNVGGGVSRGSDWDGHGSEKDPFQLDEVTVTGPKPQPSYNYSDVRDYKGYPFYYPTNPNDNREETPYVPRYDGGRGEGYIPNTPPPTDPPLKLKNLPHMCPQVGRTAMCGIFAFDYISKIYGGDKKGINKSDFAELIGIDSKEKAFDNFFFKNIGIDGDGYKKIADTFFENEKIYSDEFYKVTESLKLGNPIISVYGDYDGRTNSVKDGHAVVIVGYDSKTNKLTIADSLSSTGIREVKYDITKFHEMRSIKGMKGLEGEDRKYKNNEDWWKECGI